MADEVAAPLILIVEDDAEIGGMLRDALIASGMRASLAGSGREMDALMEREAVDLIVLDVMLPGEDGLKICMRLRHGSQIPIVMLTAMGEEVDRILGIEIGADDYIAKPFSTREVIARIRGLLRRTGYARQGTDSRRPLRFDGWRLDPLRRQLHDPDNTRISLTTTEFDLLLAFCRNAGRVLTREELLALTHAGLAGPAERSIDVHIRRLRQKIEHDAGEPVLLKTVRLGGYLFTAKVESL